MIQYNLLNKNVYISNTASDYAFSKGHFALVVNSALQMALQIQTGDTQPVTQGAIMCAYDNLRDSYVIFTAKESYGVMPTRNKLYLFGNLWVFSNVFAYPTRYTVAT